MLIVSGHLEFDGRAARDRAVAEGAAAQAATRQWPGCLAYCFSADPVDEHRLVVFEAWRDGAALREHFTHPDYAAMRAVLNAGGRVADQREGYPRVHHVVDSMPVYGPDRRPLPAYFEED